MDLKDLKNLQDIKNYTKEIREKFNLNEYLYSEESLDKQTCIEPNGTCPICSTPFIFPNGSNIRTIYFMIYNITDSNVVNLSVERSFIDVSTELKDLVDIKDDFYVCPNHRNSEIQDYVQKIVLEEGEDQCVE